MLGELCTSNNTRPRASTSNRRPRAPTSASPSEIRATTTKFLATLNLKNRATLENDELPGLNKEEGRRAGASEALIVGGTFASQKIHFSSQISNESQMFHIKKATNKDAFHEEIIYTRCLSGRVLRYPAPGLGGPPTSWGGVTVAVLDARSFEKNNKDELHKEGVHNLVYPVKFGWK